MSVRVLKRAEQNVTARAALDARGLTWRDPFPRLARRIVDKLRGAWIAPVGMPVKSWDVLETVQFLEEHVRKDSAIVDLGAWSSEIVVALHRAGFTNLHGIDLNPNVKQMPYWWRVRYRVGDMMRSGYPAASFAAVTAMSSMEHGLDAEAFLSEVTRLLKPGGFFVASTDYWPEKVDTSTKLMYDMPWTIFSKDELEGFLALAATKGLVPVGPLDLVAEDAPIHVLERDYTFAWLALQKRGS